MEISDANGVKVQLAERVRVDLAAGRGGWLDASYIVAAEVMGLSVIPPHIHAQRTLA
jgi:hypothetical protein